MRRRHHTPQAFQRAGESYQELLLQAWRGQGLSANKTSMVTTLLGAGTTVLGHRGAGRRPGTMLQRGIRGRGGRPKTGSGRRLAIRLGKAKSRGRLPLGPGLGAACCPESPSDWGSCALRWHDNCNTSAMRPMHTRKAIPHDPITSLNPPFPAPTVRHSSSVLERRRPSARGGPARRRVLWYGCGGPPSPVRVGPLRWSANAC